MPASRRRTIRWTSVVTVVLALGSLQQATAASGRLHLETASSSGGSPYAFDIDGARLVVPTAASADVRLGTNRTTGYRQLLAMNGAGVVRLGAVDFGSVDCPALRAAPYAAWIATGESATTDPVPGVVYAAKSVADRYVKLLLIQVDRTDPNGLIFDYTTMPCPNDPTPPVITAVVDGPEGNAGWYVGDVTVSWSLSDPESQIFSSQGCVPVTLADDTGGTVLTCSAVSGGGSATQSVSVKIDATVPDVSHAGNLPDGGTYTVDQTVLIDCSASDALSGLASDTCVDVDAPAYSFPVGDTTLQATALDVAGNEGTGSVTFTVVVDLAGMSALIDRFVTDAGVAQSLKAKLQSAADAPNQQSSSGKLAAFRNQVKAQAGKSLSESDAQILIDLSGSL